MGGGRASAFQRSLRTLALFGGRNASASPALVLHNTRTRTMAWWEDKTDPTIRLLTLNPANGELWDSPGKAVALAKMVAAVVSGAAPKMGDNAKVDL